MGESQCSSQHLARKYPVKPPQPGRWLSNHWYTPLQEQLNISSLINNFSGAAIAGFDHEQKRSLASQKRNMLQTELSGWLWYTKRLCWELLFQFSANQNETWDKISPWGKARLPRFSWIMYPRSVWHVEWKFLIIFHQTCYYINIDYTLDLILSLFNYGRCPWHWGRQQEATVSSTKLPGLSVLWINAAKAACPHVSPDTLRHVFYCPLHPLELETFR